MRVISLKRLREFWEHHPDAKTPLRLWYTIASKAHWRSLQELRQAFPQADGVKDATGNTLTVFNIGGNKYRLIVRIRYDYKLINVRSVLTHADYEKGKWKD